LSINRHRFSNFDFILDLVASAHHKHGCNYNNCGRHNSIYD